MLAIIQEIASKSYTFREVAAYVTIAVCMSFAVGFLLAAFTRIFKEDSKNHENVSTNNLLVTPRWVDVLFPSWNHYKRNRGRGEK